MINTSTNSSFPSQVVPLAEKLSWEYGLQDGKKDFKTSID